MSKPKPNKQVTTAKGTYFLAVDVEKIYTSHRHTDESKLKSEGKRLAHVTKERILILRVVGIIDKRVPNGNRQGDDVTLTQSKEKV